MPCKPLFFDLAGNHLAYPALKGKAAPLKQKQPQQQAQPQQAPQAEEESTATATSPTAAASAAAGSVADTVTGMLKSFGGWWGGGNK